MSAIPSSVLAAEEIGLRYVSDSAPGIMRQRKGRGFAYLHPKTGLIKDEKVLTRIRQLAIPPAYQRVWICPDPKGHLQATGCDAKGRKQYRYHPDFRLHLEGYKFDRMLDFGRCLPSARKAIATDLDIPHLPRKKVLAIIVNLLEKSLIRIGNAQYAETNKSFGLTTLKNRHVQVEGSSLKFKFVGKSSKAHEIEVSDRRLARVVKRLQELPGQSLFQYLDESSNIVSVTSQDVNQYLRDVTGGDFTAKDFRTWWGSVLAMEAYSLWPKPETKAEGKRATKFVLEVVSSRLGNTPTVCRKSYIHPAVFEAYETGNIRPCDDANDECHSQAEAGLLKLLSR